jgi:hypothetical protein
MAEALPRHRLVAFGFPRPLRVLSAGAAALLLVVTVWQAPHTVHHLLEEGADGDRGCAVATSAERTPAIAPGVVIVAAVASAEFTSVPAGQPTLPIPASEAFSARAPPALLGLIVFAE